MVDLLRFKPVRSAGELMPCLAWATPEVGLNPSRVLDFVQDYPAMSLVWMENCWVFWNQQLQHLGKLLSLGILQGLLQFETTTLLQPCFLGTLVLPGDSRLNLGLVI